MPEGRSRENQVDEHAFRGPGQAARCPRKYPSKNGSALFGSTIGGDRIDLRFEIVGINIRMPRNAGPVCHCRTVST